MTRQKLTAILAMTVLLAVLPPSVNAESAPSPPDPEKDFSVIGAGASFPFPLIDLWRVEYKNEFDNVNLNYQSIGSGGGIRQHIEKTVNFAASDKPLGSEAKQAPKTLHIPEAIGGVVIAYNLPEVPQSGLQLTGEIIADIFLDKITKWNDPQIVAINPDLDLPDEDIVQVYRSDGSGTTFIFTDYLSTTSPEFEKEIGKGKSVQWPQGIGGKGNEGVTLHVRSTPYSIGYIELAYAFQNNMNFVHVQNGDGTAFVPPTLKTLSAASAGTVDFLPAAHCDWSKVTIVNAPGANSYPIASFTYLLLYEELDKTVKGNKDLADTIVHMIHWMITDGQKHSSSLLYVPIPESVTEIGKQGLARVTYDGQSVFDYDNAKDIPCTSFETMMQENQMVPSDTATSYKIPNWIKENARLWADGLITDQDYINGLQFLISQGILKV